MKNKKAQARKIYLFVFSMLLIGIVAAEILSIEPPSQDVPLGEIFEINVSLDNTPDLYSFQFDLSYDPTVLEYDGYTLGPFLGSDGASVFPVAPDTSTPGLLDNFAATRMGATAGVGGGGVLATFRFNATTEGVSNFDFSNSLLYDSQSTPQQIPHTTTSGNATIIDCDVDGDGYYSDSISCGGTDCNDNDPDEYPGQTWYKDVDGDLYSDGTTLVQCERPVNYYVIFELIIFSGDCNDLDSSINPDASEECDGVDNNCDSQIDEDFSAEQCQYVCEAMAYNYDGSRIGNLRCCGNNANENNPFQDPETNCYDGSDNDCDSYIDLFDSDCSGQCTNGTEDDIWVAGTGTCNQCGYDGDNDGDQPGDWSSYPAGIEDMCDSDCGIVTTTIQIDEYEVNEISCYNGLDDDCDGMIDTADIDCNAIIYDINQDGFVNIGDISMAAMQFGTTGCDIPNEWCGRRDVSRDHDVGILDLQLVGMHFD